MFSIGRSKAAQSEDRMRRVMQITREKLQRVVERNAVVQNKAAERVHRESASHDSMTNGFTKGRTMRRIGSIPARAAAELKADADMRDDKYVKNYLKKKGFSTVQGKF